MSVWKEITSGGNQAVTGREFPVSRLEMEWNNPSHAMSLWATPYMKTFPLFQWALRTSAYVHTVICVPCCWMYVAYPKALKRWKNNCVNLDGWEKLTFPNECLALNLLFPKILSLNGIFKCDIVRTLFQYLMLCAAQDFQRNLNRIFKMVDTLKCNKELTIWRVFLKYLKWLQSVGKP